MSGLDTDQQRLKSLSGTDVRYLISYFLRKRSLIAWIVVNISFSISASTATVNKLLRLERGILWYYLISYSFKLQCRRKQLRYFSLLLVTALITTRSSLWREPNVLNPNAQDQLHPGLQWVAPVCGVSTKMQILPLRHDDGTGINFGFSRKMTARATRMSILCLGFAPPHPMLSFGGEHSPWLRAEPGLGALCPCHAIAT